MVVKQIFHYREGSFLSRFNPVLKLVCLVFFCILTSFKNYFTVFPVLLLLLILLFLIKIPFFTVLSEGSFLFFLVIVSFFADFIDKRNFLHALLKAVSFLNIVFLSVIFTDTTSITDLLKALGRNRFALVICMTLSMTVIVSDCISETIQARKARGEKLMKKPLKALYGICVTLVLSLIDKVETYSDVFACRGFETDSEVKS